MSSNVIELHGLVKDYDGVRALDGVDLEMHRGEVFGFIGPNGAGKSTAIRIMLDLLRPTAGQVRVLGEVPRGGGSVLRGRLGYLPGELVLDERATGRQLLEHLAAVRGGRGQERIGPLAERFLLDLDRPTRTLSKGNKQKIGVIQALMHRPELALLDEPTSGLDPLLQQEFLALLREERDAGVSVFLSSHVLSEVEGAADRVALIRDGRIVVIDRVARLRAQAGQLLELTVEGTAPGADGSEAAHDSLQRLLGVLSTLPGIDELGHDGAHVRAVWHGAPGPLLAALAPFPLVRLQLRDGDLEDVVLDAYRRRQ
jgi:ABC-2 type transport system ATP-binding protein